MARGHRTLQVQTPHLKLGTCSVCCFVGWWQGRGGSSTYLTPLLFLYSVHHCPRELLLIMGVFEPFPRKKVKPPRPHVHGQPEKAFRTILPVRPRSLWSTCPSTEVGSWTGTRDSPSPPAPPTRSIPGLDVRTILHVNGQRTAHGTSMTAQDFASFLEGLEQGHETTS